MILFYCTAMEELAKKIAENEKIVLGKISWGRFENGFPNLFIENVEGTVEGQDVAFLASFQPENILEQLAVIYALPRYGAKSFKIILPFFATGTMERIDEEGQVATAMTLARMLSAIECETALLVIYDIHSRLERFYFRKPILPKLQSAVPLLQQVILGQDVTICFPDEGSWARFGYRFREYSRILCHKERLGEKRKVKIIEGSPKGKNVVIVDDLVITGGTLLECAKVLEQKGAKSVSAYATHAVFPNRSWVNMKNFPFVNFWITDSCPETIKSMETVSPITKFEVLSLAPSIAKILAS